MKHPAQMIQSLYGLFFSSYLTEILTNHVAKYLRCHAPPFLPPFFHTLQVTFIVPGLRFLAYILIRNIQPVICSVIAM